MIELWGLIAVMVACVLAVLLWGNFRRSSRGPEPLRAEYDKSVYLDQLAEIDRDLELGWLNAGAAEDAQLEIQRRLLRLPSEIWQTESGVSTGKKLATAGLVAAIILSALPLYLFLGKPDLPGQPYAARQNPDPTPHQMAGESNSVDEMIASLAMKLEQNPGDARGWLLFARSLVAVERYDEATQAYSQVTSLTNNHPSIAIHYAELLVKMNGENVPPKALAMFADIILKEPANVRARYYVGLAKAQSGNIREALQDWVDLLALSPPDAPWTPGVKSQIQANADKIKINASSIKPSAAVLALKKSLALDKGTVKAPVAPPATPPLVAAIPGGDRSAFILSMVDGLATRLKDEPDDLDGWKRLARAYGVLGKTEKAQAAFEQVKRLEGD